MPTSPLSARLSGALAAGALVAGCASTTTTTTLQPSPQTPVCDASAQALVLWAPHWRPDQKDVSAREDAAAAGLDDFFARSGCFARTDLRRVPALTPAAVQAEVGRTGRVVASVVGVEVRELGPVVKLLASAALVDGGTEVLLRISMYSPSSATELRQFTVHWQDGGPGVVKGVASLPADMRAALQAGLQPGAAAR